MIVATGLKIIVIPSCSRVYFWFTSLVPQKLKIYPHKEVRSASLTKMAIEIVVDFFHYPSKLAKLFSLCTFDSFWLSGHNTLPTCTYTAYFNHWSGWVKSWKLKSWIKMVSGEELLGGRYRLLVIINGCITTAF